jgi:hypothetical protein
MTGDRCRCSLLLVNMQAARGRPLLAPNRRDRKGHVNPNWARQGNDVLRRAAAAEDVLDSLGSLSNVYVPDVRLGWACVWPQASWAFFLSICHVFISYLYDHPAGDKEVGGGKRRPEEGSSHHCRGKQPGPRPGHLLGHRDASQDTSRDFGGATARKGEARSGGHGPGSEARNQGGFVHSFAHTSRTTRTRNTTSR